jgi:hypothetical protein
MTDPQIVTRFQTEAELSASSPVLPRKEREGGGGATGDTHPE